MALNLPVLTDGDDRFTKLVMRLRPSQLGVGEVALSENGRMELDGSWQVREGYKNVSGVVLTTTDRAILAGSGEAAALMLIGVQSGGNATAAIVSNVCTVTCNAAHGLPSGHTSTINLASFTAAGAGVDINGNRTVTYATTTTFTFSITSADDTYTGGNVGPVKLSGDPVQVYGSCVFSDPATTNGDYILIADNTQATAIEVATGTKTNVTYPAGETLNQDVDINQEFNKVVLRQNGKTSWTWDMDLTGSPAFAKMSSGAKTQHSIFTSATNTAISAGVATVTETGHGITQDASYDPKTDPPRTVTVVDSPLSEIANGTVFTIATVADANTFTFKVDADDTSTNQSFVYSTGASLGGGFINAPGVAWGVEHQRRSWVPYTHDAAATPAARNVSDEIIASDILDNTTYDPIGNQFRISGGRADEVVALHGFDDDRLIVFCRNSIHYISGVSGSLDDTRTIELTNEIGCIARKSVASYANQVFFLSDSGVYSVSFLDEYNLRGSDLPLSEAVEPIIQRITPGSANKAIGVYHDNRYWIAVPLDGNTFNSHILVYNFLNRGWESLDRPNVDGNAWGIEELLVTKSGKMNELYAVTTFGGVHKLDRTGRERDQIYKSPASSSEEVLVVPGKVKTRQYSFGDLRRKKFNRVRVHMKSDDAFLSQGDFTLIVEDPDQSIDLGELRDEFTSGVAAGEDATYQKRLGNPRGFAAQLQFDNAAGLPKIRSVQMDAVSSFESTTSLT